MQEEGVERRIVTVLFADLVGFTALSEKYDAEDVAAIQDRYFAAVRETIGRYGGRLEKFIGDAAMAVFGVPRGRDDDAERAVRAGLALIHAVQQIGTTLGLDEDALRLRVGINTGEAVTAAAGPDEGRVTGDTVNTAARLQTAAPPMGVLIGETTALAVAGVAELGAVMRLELKGKAEPVAARLVEGFRAEPSRDEAMGALRAPTLGREREIGLLKDAFERAAGGAVERWLVVAPPGVGKTRLLREIATRLAQHPSTPALWRTRTRPDAVSPFEAVATLLREAFATPDAEVASQTLRDALNQAGVSEMRAGVVIEACLSVAWPPTIATDGRPSDNRDALFAAWLEGLDALAAGKPQVWLFEDAHWAGGDVLAFIDLASQADAASEGRLILATARPSLLETNADWATDTPDVGRRVLQLPTLAPTDARELIAALVGDALPPELVERIAERSDGNCLFIEELLRTWVSVGSLVRDEQSGTWRLAVTADEIALPQSVQSIYAAQLDDLPPDARQLARRASVAGRRFPVGALEPLGVPSESGLQPLRRRELVVGPQTEPLFGTAYSYRHALLRDAGYASLARAERARLHVRLARWLEEAAGDHAGDVAEQIAGHYGAALENAPQLAAEVDEGLDRGAARVLAATWYERAGQSTLSVSAHDAARQLFKRSIDLTPDTVPADQARRWERLGDATASRADMDEAAQAYRKAIDLYRVAIGKIEKGFNKGADAMTLGADKMLGKLLKLPGMNDEGRTGLERGARELRAGAQELRHAGGELADALGAVRSGLARSTSSLADVMYEQLQFADARDLVAATLDELTGAGELDPASHARLLAARGMSRLGATGRSDQEEVDLMEAVELAKASGDKEVELRALQILTMARDEGGDGSPEGWQELAALAASLGNWREAVSANTNAASRMLDDRARDVFAITERVREQATAHGLVEDAGWIDYVEAEAAFVSGDWERAVSMGLSGMDLGEAKGYRRLAARCLHVLLPIGAVRGERYLLERSAAFYESLIGKFEFPDSPYTRIIKPAQDLELAAAGLMEKPQIDVEGRIGGFADEPGGGSWSAAQDRVFRHWMESGQIDGAAQALAALDAAMPRYKSISTLGRGAHQLFHGRLAEGRGEKPRASKAGRAALDHFRKSNAPWWMAKAIRLLERAGSADTALLEEVAAIESRLGAVAPTT